MNRTFKTLALSCVTGLMMAGAVISPADARGGGGFGGGHGGGGFGGGHGGGFGGGHYGGGHFGGGHFAGGYGGHHGHGFRHNRFFAGGLGYYDGDYYDYGYGDDDCGYARNMWHRTGTSYWRHRYYACVS